MQLLFSLTLNPISHTHVTLQSREKNKLHKPMWSTKRIFHFSTIEINSAWHFLRRYYIHSGKCKLNSNQLAFNSHFTIHHNYNAQKLLWMRHDDSEKKLT